MIPKIQNSPQFVQEYTGFQKRISAVTNEALQTTLTKLLTSLKNEIVFLDRHHESLYISNRMPTDVVETRDSISNIRKEILNKLTAWESSQLVR
jgi:hypothetical protein